MNPPTKCKRVTDRLGWTSVPGVIAALGAIVSTMGCELVEREAKAQQLTAVGAGVSAADDAAARATALGTGIVGIGFSQEAQLHVTHLPPDPVLPPDPTVPPDPVLPPDPVHLMLSFVDQAGRTLAEKHVVLDANRSDTLRLAANTAPRSRLLLRGGIQPCTHPGATPPPDDGFEKGKVLGTLEVVDALTGRTGVVLNPLVLRGFNPQPEPPGAGPR